MSTLTRSLVPLVLAGLVAACSGPASPSAPGGSPGSSGQPDPTPDATDASTIDHPTGAGDILLQYEEGGGFVMPAWAATQAPIFTLYGDGTVVFRDPREEAPPPEGDIMRNNPFRTATLTEEQVQDVLAFALQDGGLAAAKARYPYDMVADASTAYFRIHAGGIEKTVEVYALGMDPALDASVPDAPARAAFAALADRLMDFDQGGAFSTEVYEPPAYRGVLMDSGGFAGTNPIEWPWADIAPSDFVEDQARDRFFPTRVMTDEEVSQLGIDDYMGGFMNMSLIGPDGKTYQFSLRPLLPGETD